MMKKWSELQYLSNRFFACRHAHSVAQDEAIIVSWPKHGQSRYGLSDTGQEQPATAVRSAVKNGVISPKDVVIASSEFLRALETARAMASALRSAGEYDGDVVTRPDLCERDFGKLELHSNTKYNLVWDQDRRDPTHTRWDVESAEAVQIRMVGEVLKLDKRFVGKEILLVSHGDALQILETAFRGISPALHRTFPPFLNAEIRPLHVRGA